MKRYIRFYQKYLRVLFRKEKLRLRKEINEIIYFIKKYKSKEFFNIIFFKKYINVADDIELDYKKIIYEILYLFFNLITFRIYLYFFYEIINFFFRFFLFFFYFCIRQILVFYYNYLDLFELYIYESRQNRDKGRKIRSRYIFINKVISIINKEIKIFFYDVSIIKKYKMSRWYVRLFGLLKILFLRILYIFVKKLRYYLWVLDTLYSRIKNKILKFLKSIKDILFFILKFTMHVIIMFINRIFYKYFYWSYEDYELNDWLKNSNRFQKFFFNYKFRKKFLKNKKYINEDLKEKENNPLILEKELLKIDNKYQKFESKKFFILFVKWFPIFFKKFIYVIVKIIALFFIFISELIFFFRFAYFLHARNKVITSKLSIYVINFMNLFERLYRTQIDIFSGKDTYVVGEDNKTFKLSIKDKKELRKFVKRIFEMENYDLLNDNRKILIYYLKFFYITIINIFLFIFVHFWWAIYYILHFFIDLFLSFINILILFVNNILYYFVYVINFLKNFYFFTDKKIKKVLNFFYYFWRVK